tara:strand:+ start:12290 stop:13411 length:1122 start_codon:yes stop_codon:yes gene_type:complete
MVDFRDVAGALASGFNQMRLRPDPGLDARLQTIQQQRTANRAKNKTVEYLRGLGTDMANQLASMVESGALTGQQAYAQILQLQSEERSFNRQKELEQYKVGLTAAKTPTSIQEYNLAVSQGYKGTFEDWEKSDKRSAEFGTIPAGYQLIEETNDQGQNVYRMTPVKGSPDYIDEQKRIKQEEMAKQGKIGSTLSFYSAGKRVIDAINKDDTLIPKTGVLAGLIRDTVFGQQQKNVAEDLAIMEAQMQFETLAQLKAQSPSGASGLGQLTDSERRALGKIKYNFDALQGEEAIKRNIRSAMLMRAYFENGLLDPETNTYRNATEEELEAMTLGINPFTEEGGPRLIGVGRYLEVSPPKSSNRIKFNAQGEEIND